jgi:hypothetical protein
VVGSTIGSGEVPGKRKPVKEMMMMMMLFNSPYIISIMYHNYDDDSSNNVKVLVESIQHVSYKTTVQRYKYLL